MDIEKFEFAPDDRIDRRAYEIIDRTFGIEAALLTEESQLEDFEFTFDANIPGHKLLNLPNIPLDDRILYPNIDSFDDKRVYIWYPPFTEKESRRLALRSRIKVIRMVEKEYSIKLKDFKDIDKYPRLKLFEIADKIDRLQLEQLMKMSDSKD